MPDRKSDLQFKQNLFSNFSRFYLSKSYQIFDLILCLYPSINIFSILNESDTNIPGGLKEMAEQQETNSFLAAFNGKNPFQGTASMPEALRILSKSAVAGIEIYDAWLEGLHDLTKESFTLCRKVADGENADSETILNATSEMCEKVTTRMMQAVKDTPFEAMIEPSLKAIQKSTDFKKNGYMMKALLQPGIDLNISMITMFRSYRNASEKIWDKSVSGTV